VYSRPGYTEGAGREGWPAATFKMALLYFHVLFAFCIASEGTCERFQEHLYCLHPVVCHDVFFWPPTKQIDPKLSQRNSTVLRWFYLVAATCFDLRSQWLPGLRHELSSFARMLESWVRIPLETWMSVFILLVLGSGLATG
jgi:hypothetical protein